jgi:hypothetical protein
MKRRADKNIWIYDIAGEEVSKTKGRDNYSTTKERGTRRRTKECLGEQHPKAEVVKKKSLRESSFLRGEVVPIAPKRGKYVM